MGILSEEMAAGMPRAVLINVLDGDTVDLDVNLGLG
ncbi:unnamed protein product, partial [marine sediment metagenome]